MARFCFINSSGWSCFTAIPLILTAIILFGALPASAFNHIFSKGSQLSCSEEGEVVELPFLKQDPCITCVCQNSVVNCFKATCAESHHCYYRLSNSTSKCCTECKGCFFNGKYLKNGETTHDDRNVCQSFQCNSGTLTSYRTECHVPCANPISIRGQCCPSCNVCPRRNARDGQKVLTADAKEPCINCYCFKGQLICNRKVCPVLPCPKSSQVKPANSCCPLCKGKKDANQLDLQSCLLADKMYQNGAELKYDECSSCVCQNSTVICHRQTCPSLQCEESKQIRADGQCCPSCALASTTAEMCHHKGLIYKEGEWWRDTCQKCTCRLGKVYCAAKPCPRNFVCPSGYQKVKMNGDCCESCAQVGASCQVKDALKAVTTFDGKRYRFEGKCNYVLTRHCQTKQFAIHLLNKFRPSPRNASMSQFEGASLMVKIEGTKIHMSPLGIVRVNRTPVALPYVELGHFSIAKFGHRIKLRATKMEFEVLWVPNVSVEVKVRNRHQGLLCGLCGNFNRDTEDEFQLRNSKRIANVERFVKSFEVGQNLLCPKRPRSARKKSMLQKVEVIGAMIKFNSLKLDSLAQICERVKARNPNCRDRSPSEAAFQQCVRSIAACDNDNYCKCLALEMFAHNCDSRKHNQSRPKTSLCKRRHCPPGSEFKVCSHSCNKTCPNRAEHQQGGQQCQRKKCHFGCECIGNRVWHNHQCIPAMMCP